MTGQPAPTTPVAASAESLAASAATSECPLNNFPENLHNYFHSLESRILHLEKENKRFSDALKAAGKFIFDSPMSKPMLSVLPKEAQIKLKEFFSGNQ